MIKEQYTTEQEAFWAGDFGADYINRNQGARKLAGNLSLFAEILNPLPRIERLLEIGANVGQNLRALAPSGRRHLASSRKAALTPVARSPLA